MDRRRLWLIIDRQKASYRTKIKSVFMGALEKQIKPLYEKIELISNIRDLEIPPLNDQAIQEAYKRLYMATALPFAMDKRRQRKWTKGEDEIFEDLIMEQILVYLRNNVGSEIRAVGDTSKLLIQRLLDRLIPEIMDQGIGGGGAAQTMLRDRIKSEWHRMKYYRTERIVRTEVNRAANWGSLEGARSLDIPQNKVWISAFAPESRPEHEAADGQKRDLNEPFEVWGESLMYPGDPAGSGQNTINCLCSTYEEVK